MITFDAYRLRYMVRGLNQMVNYKPTKGTEITLPRSALIHYISDTVSEYGIRPSHPLLVNGTAPVRVMHIAELTTAVGSPRSKSINATTMVRAYFRDKPSMFNRINRLDRSLREPRSVLVLDYSLIPHRYIYPKTRTAFFDQLTNVFATQIDKINEIGGNREQFIMFNLPEVIPHYNVLKRLPDPIPVSKLNDWRDHDSYALLFIWRLLGNNSMINPEAAKRLNLVFHESGYVAQVNFADLVSWYADDPAATERGLYRLWTNLAAKRTVADTETVNTDEVDPEKEAETQPTVDDEPLSELQEEDIIGQGSLVESMDELVKVGRLSAAEQRRLEEIAQSYKTIPNPFGSGSLEDLATIPPEDLVLSSDEDVIPDREAILDKGMLKGTLNNFTRNYVKKIMERDIAGMVLSFQNAGVLVKDYNVTRHIDAVNDFKEYEVSLVPVNGKPSIFRFKLPTVNEDGEFIANGVRNRLDNQKGDLPIRKINSARVALTSYYGKAFVNRSPKAVNNYGRWIIRNITKAAMNAEDSSVTDIVFTSNPLPRVKLPRHYTAIAEQLYRFNSGPYQFFFGYDAREKEFGKAVLERVELDDAVICGQVKGEKDTYLSMDTHGFIYKVKPNGTGEMLGSIATVINPDWGEGPVEFSELKVFGKNVPVGLALSYLLGLDKVIKALKVPHRWVEAGKRLELEPYEVRFRFRNESLILDRRHQFALMILGGLNAIKRISSEYESAEFNKPNIYGHVLDSIGIGRHVVREIKLMNQMFIDPITKALLVEMGEPTTFIDLLYRGTELLMTDEYTDEMDSSQMRIKGYERFSGFVYNQMVAALREHANAGNKSRSQVSVNPVAVWGDIIADPAKILVEESNPIHNLKEKSSVTFVGQGGRQTDTMVARTRIFHQNDIGVISESTPDSSKVGIRSYMTPNAKLNSLRGTTTRFDFEKDGPISALSATAMFNPGATMMDAKRANLAAVQMSSMVSAAGGIVMPVRTGYEMVIANSCSDRFAYDAKGPGKVLEITDKVIRIEYTTPEGETLTKGIRIGVVHGTAAGAVIPHKLVTDLRVGDTFNTGEVLVWNDGYFGRDYLNPGGVSMKGGVLARIAFKENSDTLEDGSSITPELSQRLQTPISKVKTILVDYDKVVANLVKVGDTVDLDSILCTIEDASIAELGGDDKNLLGLTKLTGSTPKADMKGTVSFIEVTYLGDKQNMDDSLRRIANADARRRKQLMESTGDVMAETGEIFESTYIGGKQLVENTMAIQIYMDKDIDNGVGDKNTYGNVLKSITGRVMEGVNRSEDGQLLDGIFGYLSVAARIVPETEINGITTTTLIAIGDEFVRIYDGGR